MRQSRNTSLIMEFVNDRDNKRADLNINDRLFSLDQEEKYFTQGLNNTIRQGNNFIEIRPRTEMNIVELRVEVD